MKLFKWVKEIVSKDGKLHFKRFAILGNGSFLHLHPPNLRRRQGFETIEDGFAPNHICEATGELAEARRYYVDMPGARTHKGVAASVRKPHDRGRSRR